MDFQNFLTLSLYFLFLFYLPNPSHSPIQLPRWLGDKKMHISLSRSLCVRCACMCLWKCHWEWFEFDTVFTSKDQCLKLKKGGFFVAFYPTHPRSLCVFILINFRLWWYGCELVVVVGWRWRRQRFVVVAVWLVAVVGQHRRCQRRYGCDLWDVLA